MKNDKNRLVQSEKDSKLLRSAITARRWFSEKLNNGFFGRFFGSHDRIEEYHRAGFLHTYFTDGDRTARWKETIERKTSESLSNALLPHFFRSFCRKLLAEPIKSYGAGTLAFGLILLIRSLLFLALPTRFSFDYPLLCISVIFIACSFGMIFSRSSLAYELRDSQFLKVLISKGFGVPEESLSLPINTRSHRLVIYLVACLLGGLTLFFSPFAIILGLLLLLTAFVVLSVPEIGILLLISLLPLFFSFSNGQIVFLPLLLLTEISYWLKVFSGKRLCRMEILDITVLILGMMILLSGLIGGGGIASLQNAIVSFLYLSAYFPIVGLFGGEKRSSRLHRAILIAGFLSVFLMLVGNFFGSSFSFILSDSAPLLSAFFLPFLFEDMIFGKRKVFYLFSLIGWLAGMAAFLLGGYYSILVLEILLSLIFLVVNARNSAKWIIPLVLLLTAVFVWLPIPYGDLLPQWHGFSFSRSGEHDAVRSGVMKMLGDYGICGIGFGEDAFRNVFPMYAPEGFAAVPNAMSIYLRILCDFGVVGLLLSAVFAVFWLIDLCSAGKLNRYGDADRQLFSAFLSVAFLAVFGIYNDLFSVNALCVTFWMTVGFSVAKSVAVRRTDRRNHLNTESPQSADLDYVWEVQHE